MTATASSRPILGGDRDAPAALPGFRAFIGADGATRDYAPAPEVERLADALIADDGGLGFLAGVAIRYLWRRKQQAKHGRAVLGSCATLAGLPRYALGGGDFLVTLNWANCRAARLRAQQLEALVFRQLCHIAPPDEDAGPNAPPALVGPDVAAFAAEVARYGLWTPELRAAGPTFVQATLDLGAREEAP